MRIEWKSDAGESPYLFFQRAKWDGLAIHRARVAAGRVLEDAELFHKINIALSGNLTTSAHSPTGQKKFYKRNSGDICVTSSGQITSAVWESELDNLMIFFEPDFVARTAVENRFSGNFDFFETNNQQDALVQQVALTLLAEKNNDSPAGRLYADSLIQTLTLHLLKNYTSAAAVQENTSGGLSGYRLRRVREYIDAHLEEDLSLAEIAEVADLSQFHFARAFRKSTGKTPQQYLMQQRIERAKDLLARKDLPLVEISLRAGFKNQSHFTTLFRKFTNLTPKLWRESRIVG